MNKDKGFPSPSVIYQYFILFRSYDPRKFYFLFFTIIISSLLDGLGIGLFIPLINIVSNVSGSDKISSGISAILDFMHFTPTLYVMITILAFIFILKGSFKFIAVLIQSKIKSSLTRNFRKMIMLKIFSLDYKYFSKNSIGFYNNIFNNIIIGSVDGFSKYITTITCLFNVSVYLSLAFVLDPYITTLSFVIGIILLFTFKYLFEISKGISTKVVKSEENQQAYSIQIINNYKYLKATFSFKQLFKIYDKTIFILSKQNFKVGVVSGILPSLSEPIVVIIMCLFLVFQIDYLHSSLSQSLILIFVLNRTLRSILSFQSAWQGFNALMGPINALEKIKVDFVKNNENISSGVKGKIIGDIKFESINYSFDSKKVLRDLNLKIKKNNFVGIVGPSGSGKTTFFDLLTGLLIPQKGRILIGDTPLFDINISEYRKKIGYVTQDPVVFNDTIENNISLWNKGKINQVKHSAYLSHASEFISKLPDGYNTNVGEKGVKLSGGQRQRIAIAREIFKDPELLIFDEATSSLDSESEEMIKESIRGIKGSVTMIIITHRLSTVKSCDNLYVLSGGTIVENGTFIDLYSKDGIFRQMCDVQQIKI